MGYINNNVGYPKDLLTSRAKIKPNCYAIIPPDGLVKNIVPGFEECDVTILATPKLGASFVDYLITMPPNTKNTAGFGGEQIEIFVYVIEGNITVYADKKPHSLTTGGYLYCPPGTKLYLNNTNQVSRLFLYKRRYQAIKQHIPYIVDGNVNQLHANPYENMDDVLIQDLLPKELAFDVNFHILTFKPGASHGYIETHYQEHGAYILSGEAMYNLDNQWFTVKQGDYIFMAAYCLQACYAVGHQSLSYLYSKDCHRDVEI